MANFYTDIPELKYHLNNPMMERICELKEREYRDKEEFDYAPQDYADAIDSYDKVLEITGEITGEIIAPNAEGVDAEGPQADHAELAVAHDDGIRRPPLDPGKLFRIDKIYVHGDRRLKTVRPTRELR